METFFKQNATAIIMFSGLIITIATTLSIIAVYYSSLQDQSQKNQIQMLGEISNQLGATNLDLGQKIKNLQEINLNVTNRIDTLTTSSALLIEEVKKLAIQTGVIVENIEIKTDQEFAKNTSSGELEFNYEQTKGDKLIFVLGGSTFDDARIVIGNEYPFNIGIEKGKLSITLKVFDIDDNLIAEIEDNKWHLNKNYAGKFNYDKNGFEVIDNKGFIAMSVDVVASNKLFVQGIFPIKSAQKIFMAGSQGFTTVPYRTEMMEKYILEKRRQSYQTHYNEQLTFVKMRQLFDYSGKNYIGVRKKY